ISNDISTGVPTANLKDDKIVLTNNNQNEIISNVQLAISRNLGTENISIYVEAQFVLVNEVEVAVSPLLTFSNSDFVPNWGMISQHKSTNLTFPGSSQKHGVLKVKLRERKNGVWSSYIYGDETYPISLIPGNDDYTGAITLTP